MMGIVMPETCWAYKKYNKIISGIYLVFYSSVKTDIWNMELQVEVSIEVLKWSAVVNTVMDIYTNNRTPVKYTVMSIVNHLHVSVAFATIIKEL